MRLSPAVFVPTCRLHLYLANLKCSTLRGAACNSKGSTGAHTSVHTCPGNIAEAQEVRRGRLRDQHPHGLCLWILAATVAPALGDSAARQLGRVGDGGSSPFLGPSRQAEGQAQGAGRFLGGEGPCSGQCSRSSSVGGHSQGAAVTPQLRPVSYNGVTQTWGWGSRPSHLMVCVVCVPLFFSSVFKKIFCQGEPLGHQLLALGLAAAALPGWQVAVAARVEKLGSWERLFPFGSPQAGSLEPG